MKNTSNGSFMIIILCIVVIISAAVFNMLRIADENRSTTLGINTLKSLYEFENLVQFEENIAKFKSYVSDDVFSVMTVDNADRVLRIYLKFNGNPAYVNILESTSDYIIYSLVSESIEPDRLFLFIFEEKNGKIVNIKEAELFKFPTTNSWNIDDNLLNPLELPIGGE